MIISKGKVFIKINEAIHQQRIKVLDVLKTKGTGIYYFICLELSTGKRTNKVIKFTVGITCD